MSDAKGRKATQGRPPAPALPVAAPGAVPLALVRGAALLALAALALLAAPALLDGPLGSAGWLAGDAVCHQAPDRTLTVQGRPLAVCGRCTGLFAGGAAGLLVLALAGPWRWPRWRERRWLAGLLGLLVAHVAWGGLGLPDGGNAVRFLVGLVAGAAFAPHALEGLGGLARELATRRVSP